ncbi:rab3 GTPase-activating protein non-catalytic subunit [Phoenix dactylifera]|uniref:Rab3 GTPase-activating protein non-catalytic subunit n=1 Tax=Phoenix dactylifera TaxID=42345 RepID=A0A8B7C144_PHODC|nr:rab3 GTPase-activating protein non-catalytic subunit [Phoenix dactylifera]
MARRSHLTEVGCIACDELEELGAGQREGWLDDPSLLAALHPHALALAHAARSLVLVLSWDPDPSSPRHSVKIRPSLAADDGHISALEWLPFGDLLALALGTSAGLLLVYSRTGDLVHKQILHPGRVMRMRFRETKGVFSQDSAASEELCVVLPGAIARFDGSDIQSSLRRWFQEEGLRVWENRFQNREAEDENSYRRIPFQLWNVSKFGPCADAAITGLMPPPLLEGQSSQFYYCAVTIGEDAVISAYRLSEDRSRSLVGAILSKVVPATISTLSSFSKMIWWSEQTSTKKPHTKPQPFAKALPLTCLKDPPRKGEKLTLSPGGTLAAITDSLGRILLLDTKALVVVRLWKGYRDACCLFMEMLVSRDKASSSTYHEHTKNDYCLCLAIHAPRKGIIEIWKMRTGPRVLAIQCPKGSKILQPSTRFESSTSSYIPLEVFLLNGDSGQLSVLHGSIG